MQTVLVILIVLSMALGHYEAIVKRGAMIADSLICALPPGAMPSGGSH